MDVFTQVWYDQSTKYWLTSITTCVFRNLVFRDQARTKKMSFNRKFPRHHACHRITLLKFSVSMIPIRDMMSLSDIQPLLEFTSHADELLCNLWTSQHDTSMDCHLSYDYLNGLWQYIVTFKPLKIRWKLMGTCDFYIFNIRVPLLKKSVVNRNIHERCHLWPHLLIIK